MWVKEPAERIERTHYRLIILYGALTIAEETAAAVKPFLQNDTWNMRVITDISMRILFHYLLDRFPKSFCGPENISSGQ